MSVQLDLFDLLDAPARGTETVWQRIRQLAPHFGSQFTALIFEDNYGPSSEGGYFSSEYNYEYNRRGIWIERSRFEGKPDLTWAQVRAEFQEQIAAMPSGMWKHVQALWDAYLGTLPEFTAAQNAPGYYASDPAWHARVQKAKGAMSVAYIAFRSAFIEAFDLQDVPA